MLETEKTIPSEQTVTDDALREPLASLTVELSRISAEIQSINSGFQAQLQSALQEAREKIRQELQKEFEKELNRRVSRVKEARVEIEKATETLDTVNKE